MTNADLKVAEEERRERNWDPKVRWQVLLDAIAWAESQGGVDRNTKEARLAEQREKLRQPKTPREAIASVFRSDTHPDAAAAQVELLRRATTRQRFSLMASLLRDAVFHAKRAIVRAHPELGPRERDLLFVEMTYGEELAAEVRRYLENGPA